MDLILEYNSDIEDENDQIEFNTKNIIKEVKDCRFNNQILKNKNRNINKYNNDPKTILQPYISKRKRDPSNTNDVKNKKQTINSIPLFKPNEFFEHIISKKKSIDKCPNTLDRKLIDHKKGINCIRWGKNKSNFLLASASMDKMIKIWDPFRSNDSILSLNNHKHAVKDIQWSNDGKFILSGGYDQNIILTDISQNAQIIRNLSFLNDTITSLLFHPTEENIFFAGTIKKGLFSIDIRENNKYLKIFNKQSSQFGTVACMCFLPDNNKLITSAVTLKSGITDQALCIWDWRSASLITNKIYTEPYACPCIKIHPRNNFFAVQSAGNYIASFSTTTYKRIKNKNYTGHFTDSNQIGISFNNYGTILGTGDASGDIFYYNVNNKKIIKKFKAHESVCTAVEFHPNFPNIVASAGWDGKINFYKNN